MIDAIMLNPQVLIWCHICSPHTPYDAISPSHTSVSSVYMIHIIFYFLTITYFFPPSLSSPLSLSHHFSFLSFLWSTPLFSSFISNPILFFLLYISCVLFSLCLLWLSSPDLPVVLSPSSLSVTAAYPTAYAPISQAFPQQPTIIPQQQREGETLLNRI